MLSSWMTHVPSDVPVTAMPLASVRAKALVDFANSIDITADHLNAQRGRLAPLARLVDAVTGVGAKRQAEINGSLAAGVAGSLEWLVDLTQRHAESNLAIARVNCRVNDIGLAVARTADYSAETREQVRDLAALVARLEEEAAGRLARLELRTAASEHADRVFNAWRAGRFAAFAPLAQCFVVLQELYWGAYGDYIRATAQHEQPLLLESLGDRLARQLADELGSVVGAPVSLGVWTAQPDAPNEGEALDTVRFLGSGCDADECPLGYLVAQQPADVPLTVPRLMSASRAAEFLVEELFHES